MALALDPTTVSALLQARGPLWLQCAPGRDVDAALDAAVDTALDRPAEHPAGVSSADPASLNVLDVAPMTMTAALDHAVSVLDSLPAGVLHAIPVWDRAAFTRRTARAVIQDVNVDPGVDGSALPAELVAAPAPLWAAIDAAGAGAEPGEMCDGVTLTGWSARYKPVVAVNRGPSKAMFVVLDTATSQIVSPYLASMTLARRWAVEELKSRTGHSLDTWQVVKVAGRADEANADVVVPLAHVSRQRVRHTMRIKVVWATPKKADRPADGFLLFGRPA